MTKLIINVLAISMHVNRINFYAKKTFFVNALDVSLGDDKFLSRLQACPIIWFNNLKKLHQRD